MHPRATLARVRSRGTRALSRHVGIDVRALAALRIALGALLLVDLVLRARHLTAFYTDSGVLPRAALSTLYPVLSQLSLHALSGEAWVQGVLFLIAAGCALSLLVGYRTRLSTVCSLLLLISLHLRNPLLLSAGDVLLRRLLFWSLFLPLGSRWSVDALGATEQRDQWVVSPATAGLLVQVVIVYAVNAVVKSRGEVWARGDAILYVFSVDYLTIFLGDVLAQYPSLLRVLGLLWFVLVLGSPLLLIVRGTARTVLASAFICMHAGMVLSMKIGIFPLVSIAALLPFCAPPLWNRVERAVEASERVGRLKTWAITVIQRPRWRVSRPLVHQFSCAASTVATLCLIVLVVLNAVALGFVTIPGTKGTGLTPDSTPWTMFAPSPPREDGWVIVPGTLESGERVDAFHETAVTEARPAEVATMYPSARWRKYLRKLRTGEISDTSNFASFLCQRWNASHETALTEVSVVAMTQPTRFGEPEPITRAELGHYACS